MDAGIMIDTPKGIEFARMATLKSALKLECMGMRMSRGVSAYAICKQDYNLKGNKQKVLEQMEKLVAEALANK